MQQRVVIVGCGVIGAVIAYELSRKSNPNAPDLDITVIEQASAASGSTRAALGICVGVISRRHQGRAWTLRELSLQRYPSLLAELAVVLGEEVPSNCCGILELCFDAAQRGFWEDLAAIRAQQGYTLELIEQPQLAERHPYLNSERVEFAIASQQDLQVQPIPLTQALVAAAQQQGVKFIWSTAVQDLEVDGEAEPNCCAVITPQQVIETDWLILTGGLGTTALTQTLQKPVQLMPVLGQAIRVRLTQAFQGEQQIPVLTANDVHVAPLGKQPDGAHDYWLGATVEFPNACGDLPEQPNLLAQIKQDAIAFCPGLQAATVIETWSGLRPRPVNRAAPIIEWLPSYDNVLVASGHYRNGVLLAPATAHLVQQMLTERLQCS